MIAQVRLAVHGTAATHVFPHGITALSQILQQLYNLLIVSLIICYEYCFHKL
jgi:hypothetical protein